ncbi:MULTISPECIES: carboxymuconolactone decarboxylase family protein [unclassified Minwuia]|jgi:4-carboxymuconolactone decarboxylase|uniref:carboxymuconolactone decarboxylase family protein n=1 Tax=unclassified Minwuia TaxID=2618799 RepID=UPI002479C1CC|nr:MULTISPECIES: carboxymuconolactone decarboxylase family protein [unclassified Minwuia]
MDKDLFETGLDIRKSVVGAEYVDRAMAAADAFNQDFQNMVTEYCWGGAWGREGLSRRDRSLLNLAMLSALNRPQEFKLHFKGALKNGASLVEIREVLLQVAVYCGIPAGVEAFRLARQVMEEEGIDPNEEMKSE